MNKESEIIGKIGSWFRLLTLFEVAEASNKKSEVEAALERTNVSRKTMMYYNLVDFRHKLSSGEIVHQPQRYMDEKVEFALTETDEVLRYLYHYMEGTIHFNLEKYGLALNHYRLAEKSLHTVSELEQAEYYYRLGCNLYRIDQNIIAMNYLQTAYNTFKTSQKHLRKQLNCLINMIGIYSEAGSFTRASAIYEKAIEEADGYPYLQSLLTRAEALNQYRQKNYELAKQLFCDALQVGEHHKTVVGTKTKFNLANILLKQGEVESGISLLDEIEDEFNQNELNEYIAKCKIARGMYTENTPNMTLIQEGLHILDENDLYFEKSEVTDDVSSFFRERDDFEKAFIFLKLSNHSKEQQNLVGVDSV
ncbi:hypothetical protein ACE1TF_13850 [Geomicrobium sp. JSM 1781026]|uniref:response regulator aspartate phosphatase n=1 Tax=Geomicrobium sp. JSM 1781026 TaxID=3344580 RepID=UPI0035C0F7C2